MFTVIKQIKNKCSSEQILQLGPDPICRYAYTHTHRVLAIYIYAHLFACTRIHLCN